ncbi:MAG TPA: murein biosynthesis integral membrane protein MurJ [Alphaproteobacteria bacterium]|jgi:putative peptidoglycan lipid II flippase|nr:murein biosynthesis integral membrane protein MurJ [Alphaproteobacteria bacterium]
MLRKVASVGGLTLISRVLGFVRDIMTAALLGAGPVADAFFVAFRLPNHFRALFAEGAFNAAFVPMFSGLLVREGKEAAREFAEKVNAILLVSQVVLLVVFVIGMPWFMYVFAPGFADEPAKFDMAVLFTRITFPYLLFIALVSLLGGVLNSLGRFWAAAAAPILLNLCLIAALVFLTRLLPTAGHALAWGVFAAGIAQFLLLAFEAWRAGFFLRFARPKLTPQVWSFLRLLGTAAIGAGIVQISLFFDTLIASFLPTGSVSYLYYADRINQLPLGVIGIAVGTVLLPELSRHVSRNNEGAALWSQNRAIELSLLLTLPAALAFITIAQPIIAALFQRGAFGPADTDACATTLMAYAFGLPAFVLQKSLIPGFYARGDTATPVKVAAATVASNIAMKIALVFPFAQVGLAGATSAAGWINVALLFWILRKRGLFSLDARLARRGPRIIGAAAIMTASLIACRYFAEGWFDQTAAAGRLLYLGLLVAVGLAAFCIPALCCGLAKRGRTGG